jgi:homoserine dehydrogenase
MSGLAMLEAMTADVLFEATPVDLGDGQPGLDLVRSALGRGMSAVLANKGPLALAYQELAGRSDLTEPASRPFGSRPVWAGRGPPSTSVAEIWPGPGSSRSSAF